MTYVIAEPCINTKDTACVDVCPVDCIHPTKNEPDFEKENKLYIDPNECIDCGACEPVCPVEAIFEEAAVPDKWKQFIQIDADWYKNRSKYTTDFGYIGSRRHFRAAPFYFHLWFLRAR